jgi:hypothetical protein
LHKNYIEHWKLSVIMYGKAFIYGVQPKLGIAFALGEHLILVNDPIQGPYLPHTNPSITPRSHQILNKVLELHKD